jgi:hypothetical protein
MPAMTDQDVAISAAAVRSLLELRTREILDVLVGPCGENETALRRHLLAGDLRARDPQCACRKRRRVEDR